MTAADTMRMMPGGIELASNSTAMETADVMTNSDAMGSKSIDWLTMMTIGIGGTDDKGGREEQIKGTTMTTTIGDEGGDNKGGGGRVQHTQQL